MRSSLLVLALGLVLAAAAPNVAKDERIVGGSLTTIDQYPYQAALLWTWDYVNFVHTCSGTILNNRSILTSATCYAYFTSERRYRVRVGSTFANSGGVVHNVGLNIRHPQFNLGTRDNDIAIARLASNIVFNNQVRAASIAGPNYNIADNQAVWATGWGAEWYQGPASEQLRHVQIWTVNQDVCRNRFAEIRNVTDNMLCAGWLDVGGRDQCTGDSGGPLVHNGVVVGVSSWGRECGLPQYPGVNARVSRYTPWIVANA